MTQAQETTPEVTLVDNPRVWCDGSSGIRPSATVSPSALGHPRVWLEIDESGAADCGYCDRQFVLKGGPADVSADQQAA